MFTNEHLEKLFETPKISLQTLAHFFPDLRLSNPMRIFGHEDATRRFGEYEVYPESLGLVAYFNCF